MEEPEGQRKARAARLRAARLAAGYANAADFVRTLNRDKEVVGESTYRSYENGTRAITYDAAKILAPILRVEVMA